MICRSHVFPHEVPTRISRFARNDTQRCCYGTQRCRYVTTAWLLVIFVVALLLPSANSAAENHPPAAAIASAHPLATKAGQEILEAGGNAFDAAVAVTAALSVVEPYSTGLGGGGFWLLHRARDGFETMIDGREVAPLAATRDMYLDEQGRVIENLSMNSALAASIPGTPAALVHLAENYGRLPLEQLLAPAILLAEEGFPVEDYYQDMAESRLDVLRAHEESAQIFLRNGKVPADGARIVQPELAETLRLIAKSGNEGFYAGALAERLVAGVRAAGGIWRLEDLALYRIKEREPVRSSYRGTDITSAAPPSSGGVVLIEALNILSGYDLDAMNAITRTHLIAEAMRRAYRDRAEYLGDPDFVEMPLRMLMSPMYAAGLRASIRLDRAMPSELLPGVSEPRAESIDTTHFSVLDTEGNRVAATYTINYPFGSGFTAPGTGVLLNGQMNDFSVKPGSPNVYGLVGAEANAIEPGKRMLSSMTPTFLDDGERIAVIGTPGGSRIISMVLLATLEFIDGADAQAIVARPRYHHQYLPDEIEFEPGAIEPPVQKRLRAMGHKASERGDTYGNMHVVIWDRLKDQVDAVSDPRGIGEAVVR
ncbi:MAG: gamma-glutamyltransferase [Gammaproteobacteria bacterium]|nr:gamma-glutamyltransferase [Gammaproteobacteria bacterium]